MPIDPAVLLSLLTSPKRTRTEEGTVEERTVDELLKADQYQKQVDNTNEIPYGIRFVRLKPPSTTT